MGSTFILWEVKRPMLEIWSEQLLSTGRLPHAGPDPNWSRMTGFRREMCIVGLASFGKASYENAYNSGIGSNGLDQRPPRCVE